MKTHLFTGLKITLLTLLTFGVLYPLMITVVAQFIAPDRGEGKKLLANGRTVGFELIGQAFHSPRYFSGRPSAVNYNAAATGGSNKGPTNVEYLGQVEERLNAFLIANSGIQKKDVPVELITASGGGLDPHISPAAALVQIPRIASQRKLDEQTLQNLVATHIEHPLLGLFGPTKVNVLKLNLALDELNAKTSQ